MKAKKLLSIICGIILAGNSCLKNTYAHSVAPDKPILGNNEIAWINLTDSYIVSVWADGVIGCWELDTGNRKSSLKLPHYNFSNHSLALSGGSKPILASLEGQNIDNRCVFYNVLSGKQIASVVIPNSPGITAACFTADNSSLLCYSALESAVFKIEIAKKEVKRIECSSHFIRQIAFDKSGNIIIDSYNIECENQKGNTLWKLKKLNDDETILTRSNDSLLHDTLLLGTKRGTGIRAISLSTGKELWQKPTMAVKNIIGYSQNKQILAILNESELYITGPNINKKFKIAKINKDAEGIFSPDAKYILLIPGLKIEKRDEKKHTYTLTRNGVEHVLLVNIETGKIDKEINFKKPQQTGVIVSRTADRNDQAKE